MSRYSETFKNPQGAGDSRPTALQIVKDEGLEGKLQNKVFLITGTSSGIGIETAKAMAATGARLFLAVRNVDKGQKALQDILSPDHVEIMECDTSSQKSVKACANAVLVKTKTINGLIFNAGIMMTPTREVTEDGFEEQLATNYLGHFTLFWMLKEALIAGSTPDYQSRVVSVSSSGHHWGATQLDNLQLEGEGVYTPSAGYGNSKSAQIWMSNYIDRVYGPKGIHALSLMPGGIATNLQKHVQKFMEMMANDPEVIAFVKSPEQGAATTVYAMLSRDWEGKGGKYLEDCHVADPTTPELNGRAGYSPHIYDPEREDRLWKLTLETLKLQ